MIQVKRTDTLEAFANLRPDWNDLLKNSEVKSGFLTWEWLFTWWENFGKNQQLVLLTSWRDHQLVAIAPLMKTVKNKRGISLRLLTNIGASDSDITSFIFSKGDDEAASSLCSYINEIKNEWDVFELGEVPSEIFNLLIKNGCFPATNFVIRKKATPHLFIPIDQNWEQFYRAQTKNLKRNHKKALSKVEREGKSLVFQRLLSQEITGDHLKQVFKINEYGHFPENYRSQEIQKFHLDLLTRMSESGILNLAFLLLDGQAVAYRYGFVINNIYEGWRMGFDMRFSDFSPGSLLVLKTMQDFFERQFSLVDLLRGAEEYKRHWRVQEKEYQHFYIIRQNNWLSKLLLFWAPNIKRRLIRLQD